MSSEQEIKYSSYTQAQKKATQKYRINNKSKVNEQRKKYYQDRKENDPNFLAYKRLKSKEYYQRKKETKLKGDTELANQILDQLVHEILEAKDEEKPISDSSDTEQTDSSETIHTESSLSSDSDDTKSNVSDLIDDSLIEIKSESIIEILGEPVPEQPKIETKPKRKYVRKIKPI
jgi:hypothetical protein